MQGHGFSSRYDTNVFWLGTHLWIHSTIADIKNGYVVGRNLLNALITGIDSLAEAGELLGQLEHCAWWI